MEQQLVERTGIPFQAIPAAGVHGVGLRALPGNLAKLVRGVFASRRILHDFQPDVLFFTGGFVAAPMAVAGFKRPTALFVPDIEPGLALKFLARFADLITVTSSASSRYFSRTRRLACTGYPLRPALSAWSRKEAYSHFGLQAGIPTLLITGGSKGARSINQAVLNVLPSLLEIAQVIHITGTLDEQLAADAARQLPESLQTRYHFMPYLHEMGAALAAADLALSRAGASVLGEYPFFGLPAVLVPYPYAWRYQKLNADYLAERNAAVVLPDSSLAANLLNVLQQLLLDKARLSEMSASSRSLARPAAANEIASHLVRLAGGHTS